MKRKFPLHWQILIGLIIGVVYGGVVSFIDADETTLKSIQTFTSNWISPFGQIFINSLKLIAVPLVLFSLVSGIASLKNTAQLGEMGGRAIGYYLISTVIAVSVGLITVNVVAPWEALSGDAAEHILENYGADVESKISAAENVKEEGPLKFLVDLIPQNIVQAASLNTNMLQVIVFAVLFGVALISIPDKNTQVVKSFFDGVNSIVLKMVDIIMYLAPIGTFALISKVFIDNSENFGDLLLGIGEYGLTVITALIILILIYMLVIWGVVKRNPFQYIKSISPAQLLAFSTSSSAATLPVTMDCVTENVGVDRKVSSFVLPLGATINMDGTSCYQAVAAVFIANVMGFDLNLGDQLSIVLTATLASIGSAAVPGAGMVMLAIVLGHLGVPMEGIGLILGIDRILDMCRTVVNVTGDATISTIIGRQLGQLNTIKNVKFDHKL